jgi:hypothetical protein
MGFSVLGLATSSRIRACVDLGPCASIWSSECQSKYVLCRNQYRTCKCPGWDDQPHECKHHSRPQEDDTGNRSSIASVFQWAASVFCEALLSIFRTHTCHKRTPGRHDICVCQHASQSHHASDDGANLPRDFDTARLATFRPEEVEEEGAAEDRGDIDTNEDVEGGDADEIIIVDRCLRVFALHKLLLVDVV